MQIPVGMIADRFGLKKTLLVAVTICAIGAFGFSMCHNFALAMIFRIFMGLGAAFGFVCLLVSIYDWMPRRNVASFIGISQLIGTLGPMLSAGPMNMLAQNAFLSWRTIFMGISGIGAIIALLVLLFVDKNRQNQGKFIILSTPSSITANLLRVIKHTQTWYIAIFTAGLYFSLEYLTENDGVAFLVTKGFSQSFAAYMITVAWLGGALCSPCLGFISDKIQRRKPIMVVSVLLALFALTSIIYFPLGETLTAICFFMLGMGICGHGIGFATIAEQCRDDSLAVALGFNNAMLMIFFSGLAPIIGSILSYITQGAEATLANYQLAFTPIFIFLFIALFTAIFLIKETFCKSMCQNTVLNPMVVKDVEGSV